MKWLKSQKKIMLASLHILTGKSQKLVTCLLGSELKASVLNGNRGYSSFRVLTESTG